ncbi:hypothetical protein PGTUg99_037521 [Puccinia graminis f. sp. tritici]|uniref:Uncharacterized protein n=1 Tax=Puccinia graminis f. sp. tritici TaxID=56615 RepID=A0A5B0S1L7_PUCGR|nr:hypothetical protein PGTUg99_037521 [Puccinia graminis f. sp. tritici]
MPAKKGKNDVLKEMQVFRAEEAARKEERLVARGVAKLMRKLPPRNPRPPDLVSPKPPILKSQSSQAAVF